MTVKCLNTVDKETIIRWYKYHDYSIKELGEIYAVSPRTITRVLQDADVPTPLSQRTGYSYKVMQILNEHDITADELGPLLVLGKAALLEIDAGYLQDATTKYSQVPREFEDMPF